MDTKLMAAWRDSFPSSSNSAANCLRPVPCLMCTTHLNPFPSVATTRGKVRPNGGPAAKNNESSEEAKVQSESMFQLPCDTMHLLYSAHRLTKLVILSMGDIEYAKMEMPVITIRSALSDWYLLIPRYSLHFTTLPLTPLGLPL